ncbi:MAG: zinc-ribbon domain-containing protein [Kurthia sp.]|nr:zinc-ribbon domain-containing protein [Candidatus Kurthia equi]
MFCQNCGNKLEENAVICTNCGTSVVDETSSNRKDTTQHFTSNTGANQNHQRTTPIKEDKPNILVNILSLCCIPILGIVMYFVWKDSQPRAAKSALIFSLINIGLGIIMYIIFVVFGIFASVVDPATYE